MATESKTEAGDVVTTTVSDSVALPLVAQPIGFDKGKMNAALEADDFAEVFSTLRDFMDNRRDRHAADWIGMNSLRGHIVALYLLQRNRVKYTQAVMSTGEMHVALESAIIAVIRVHEDAAACALALGEDRDAGAQAFIHKLQYWWAQHGDSKTWPTPAAIMAIAAKEKRMRGMRTDSTVEGSPQPTWLLEFSYATYTPSWAVDFANPCAGKTSACRTNHNVHTIRASVRSSLITQFSRPETTWSDVWKVTPKEARSDVRLDSKTHV